MIDWADKKVKLWTQNSHPIAHPQVSYGVSIAGILEEIDHVMRGPHCI